MVIEEYATHTLTEENLAPVPGMLSRWVRLADGSRAHYMTSGESGPAVVLLHGGIVGSSGTAGWRYTAPFLGANGFRVYCPDRPGFGLADTSPQYRVLYGQKSQAEFLKQFVDALCIEQFHIAGNSSGCTCAVHFAVSHPERILSMVLIAGGVGDIAEGFKRLTPRESRYSANPEYRSTSWDGSIESMRQLMEGIINRKEAIQPELLEMRNRAALLQKDARLGLGASQQKLSADPNYLQWAMTKDRLDRLTIPTIYMHGKQDIISPVENGFAQEDVLPNIQFFYPNNCGHQGQTDQPEIFNQLFLEFFRDGKVSRRTADRAGVSRRRPVLRHLVDWDGPQYRRRKR